MSIRSHVQYEPDPLMQAQHDLVGEIDSLRDQAWILDRYTEATTLEKIRDEHAKLLDAHNLALQMLQRAKFKYELLMEADGPLTHVEVMGIIADIEDIEIRTHRKL